MLMLCIICTVILSQLHLLRNLTSLYFAAYFGSFAVTMLVAALTLRTVDRASKYLLQVVAMLFFIPCLAIIPGVISGEPYTASVLGVCLGRLLFTVPIFVVMLLMPRTPANIRAVTVTAGVLTVIAALSIPYQFAAGPVAWFAESSERAGIARFASLFGSITTLGIVCGMGIAVCAYSFRSAVLTTIALLAIAMGSILSLSKAGLVNVLLAFVALPFVRRTSRREVVIFFACLIAGLNVVVAMYGKQLLSFWSSFQLTGQSIGETSGDVSLATSFVDRLTDLPMIAVNFHGPWSLLLGVGPTGGAGTFGFADASSVHNGLVELLLVGGIPLLLWYLWLNKKIATAAIATMHEPGGRTAGLLSLFIFANLFVNTIFSSGVMFNPIGALFFAIGLKLVEPGVISRGQRLSDPQS